MFGFTYYTPTKVIFGKDTEQQVGSLVQACGGKRVLIHYGGSSAIKSGLIDRVKASLDAAGIYHVELGGVVPNPHLSKVYEGIELGRKENVDFLLAVGGGSTIDSAKAIAAGLANPDDDVWDYYIRKKTTDKCLPVASVLTIAAAGSEMSNGSVITNDTNWLKRDFGGELMRPKFAIMNPELTMTLPKYQTFSGIADILMHTMERFFNQAENMELTDNISIALMRTVMKYAKVLLDDPNNYNARAEIMWAGSLSHNDLTGCGAEGGDWATHNMEHEMGGMFDVAHGAGLGAVWGAWARYVYKDLPERFATFATRVMGVEPGADDEETALKGIEAFEDFLASVDMPRTLTELGIQPTDEQIKELAWKCSFEGKRTIGGNGVRELKVEDMEAIYRAAY